jgi:hypothetical protein
MSIIIEQTIEENIIQFEQNLIDIAIVTNQTISNTTIEVAQMGIQGEQGVAGQKGDKGDTGEKGLKGDVGEQGLKGDKGDIGLNGLQGAQGIQGLQGLQGVQGDKGDIGSQGLQGLKGDTGNQGIQGLTGQQGLQGIQGVKGDNGEQGPAGVSLNSIIGNAVLNFGNENDIAFLTIANTSLTNSNIKSFSFLPQETTETSLDDFSLNGVGFSIENIVNNVSFDIRGTSTNSASGNYTVKYLIQF